MNYLQLTGFDSIFNLLTSNHWCCQRAFEYYYWAYLSILSSHHHWLFIKWKLKKFTKAASSMYTHQCTPTQAGAMLLHRFKRVSVKKTSVLEKNCRGKEKNEKREKRSEKTRISKTKSKYYDNRD